MYFIQCMTYWLCIPDANLHEQCDGPRDLEEEDQTRRYSEMESQKNLHLSFLRFIIALL